MKTQTGTSNCRWPDSHQRNPQQNHFCRYSHRQIGYQLSTRRIGNQVDNFFKTAFTPKTDPTVELAQELPSDW